MLRKIAITIGILLLSLLAFAATRPNEFRVERATTINAPPDRVYALVNDFRQWNAWSPWEKLDPTMRRTLSGADSGVGAVYAWEGNKKVGKGRMEIVEASPSKVAIKLDFLDPFEAHNMAAFTMDTSGSAATHVTWTMYGPQPYMSKLMGIFFSMDKMIGKDFETGLANLKALAER